MKFKKAVKDVGLSLSLASMLGGCLVRDNDDLALRDSVAEADPVGNANVPVHEVRKNIQLALIGGETTDQLVVRVDLGEIYGGQVLDVVVAVFGSIEGAMQPVTEPVPIWMNGDGQAEFVFDLELPSDGFVNVAAISSNDDVLAKATLPFDDQPLPSAPEIPE